MARKPVTDISAWPSLTLEGNLIAPAMVASIDRRQASEQAEEDYRIRKGLTIREEVSTAFRVGQSHFDAFAKLQNPSIEATRRYVRAFLAETFGFDDLASVPHMSLFETPDVLPEIDSFLGALPSQITANVGLYNVFFSGKGDGVIGCSSAQRIISRP